jgi:hypothetical protein
VTVGEQAKNGAARRAIAVAVVLALLAGAGALVWWQLRSPLGGALVDVEWREATAGAGPHAPRVVPFRDGLALRGEQSRATQHELDRETQALLREPGPQLTLTVELQLEERPFKRAPVLSRWSSDKDGPAVFELGVDRTQRPYLMISRDGGQKDVIDLVALEYQMPRGRAVHLTAVFEAGHRVALFLNGVLVAEETENVPAQLAAADLPLVVGRRPGAHERLTFDGLVGRFRFFSRLFFDELFVEEARHLGYVEPPRKALEPVQVTQPPGFHFFGYYDKHQFDASGRYLLSMRTNLPTGRHPKPDDAAEIGVLDLEDGNKWRKLGETRAWNWQQGAMLQWRPGHDDEILFNDRDEEPTPHFVTRIVNVKTGETRTVGRASYHVHPEGKVALGLDFDRLRYTRRGYGYPGVTTEYQPEGTLPSAVYEVNLDSGEVRELLTMEQVVGLKSKIQAREGARHWLNCLSYSPSGERFLFYHRFKNVTAKGHVGRRIHTRVLSARADGSELRVVDDFGKASHFAWKDDDHILIYSGHTLAYSLFHAEKGYLHDVMSYADGHQTYLDGGRFLLTDSYPDGHGQQKVLLYDLERRDLILVGLLDKPTRRGTLRTDLHPRVDRAHRRVVVDSAHQKGGGRQMWMFDLTPILERAKSAPKERP